MKCGVCQNIIHHNLHFADYVLGLASLDLLKICFANEICEQIIDSNLPSLVLIPQTRVVKNDIVI